MESYEKKGARVIKSEGRITGPGTVEANGETVEAENVVVATGSTPNVLPIEGLENVTVWTTREAITREVPEKTVSVGGGPNGIETSQWLSRMGGRVAPVQSSDTLINCEDPKGGEIIQGVLEEEGIDVRVGRKVEEVRQEGNGAIAVLDDGEKSEMDVLVTVAGRTPRVEDIGLDALGIEPDKQGLTVDDYCRVKGIPGLWAVGDVTGVMLFTHVGQYQGRIVADNIPGGDRRTSYRGVPRVVFSDLEIAATGLTEEEARKKGLDVATATIELPNALARPVTYKKDPRGSFGLVADQKERVLVSAWAVAPLAGEWIHQVCWAIRTRTPIDTLLDAIYQFPTFSQVYLEALEKLDL